MKPTLPPTPSRLYFGRCELRTDTRELWLAGARQHVRRRVFDLMVYLISQRPRTVPHSELMQVVWNHTDVSQTALARAVMEARQACGVAADEPLAFVSVHGVGYRFAGEVRSTQAPRPLKPGEAPQAEVAVEEVRDLVHHARLAVAEHRFEQARTMAEEAMGRAQALGVQSEKVRALLVRASIESAGNRLPQAAWLANQALQIATAEGHPPLIAEARIATGGLHVLAGDRETGIRHLREAMEVFSSQPGHEAELTRCLNWLSRALRDQDELEAALQMCRRSIALTAACKGQSFTLMDQLNELQLLTELGDHLAETADAASAHAQWEAGLQAGTALLSRLDAREHRAARAACLDHLAMLFERLGRLDEARQAAQACDAQRSQLPEGAQWPDDEDRPRFRMQRAWLICRCGEVPAAMAEVRDTLADAAGMPPGEGLAELYRLAAEIAGRSGLHEQASQWLRKRCEVLVTTQRHRGASLAAILAAELDAHTLRSELDRARLEVRDVLVENAQLRRLVRQLDSSVPLAPETGLAPGHLLGDLLAPSLERARARELPMCMGLLRFDGAEAIAAQHGPAALAALLRQAGTHLAAQADVAAPAFDIGAGRIAFYLRDVGLARARVLCREIGERLAQQNAPASPLPAPPHWQCTAADAAAYGSLTACLNALAELRAAPASNEPPAAAEPCTAAPPVALAPARAAERAPHDERVAGLMNISA